MGERALAVVPDSSGEQYLCYHSQWAGSNAVLIAVLESRRPVDELLDYEWQFVGRCPTASLLDSLDFLGTEAVYLLCGGAVDVFIPLWFGISVPERSVRSDIGTLVYVRSFTAVRHCRETLRKFKGTVLDGVQDGTLPPGVATELLDNACYLVRTTSADSVPLSGERL